MAETPSVPPPQKALIRQLGAQLTGSRRSAVLQWARELIQIRNSSESPLNKTRRALKTTARSEVVTAFLTGTAGAFKDLAWDDRSWSARLGLGAAAITVAATGGQGAGIAALGTAVAVPLWIVLGAGGSFAGMLIDELSGTRPQVARPEPDGAVQTPEGEWEVPNALPPLGLSQQRALPPGSSQSDPFWRVFKSAYREARARQQEGSNAGEA
jgi:hypothetical protein